MNKDSVDKNNFMKYREYEQQANEIKQAFTQVQQETRANNPNLFDANNAAKSAQKCTNCGATTIPDGKGRCEFCGGAL